MPTLILTRLGKCSMFFIISGAKIRWKHSDSWRRHCPSNSHTEVNNKPPRNAPPTVVSSLISALFTILRKEHNTKYAKENFNSLTIPFVVYIRALFCHISLSATCQIPCSSSFCMQRDKAKTSYLS